MQTRLREHWSAPAAVLAASASFAALHVDTSAVHMVLALALGLYLGFVAEATGSALPCVVCHIVNNVLYTLQTAYALNVTGRRDNLIAAVACAVVFVACVLWVARTPAPPPPAPAEPE